MKILSTHPSVSSQAPTDRRAFRSLAVYGAIVLCVTACSSAGAQSGLFGNSNGSPGSQIASSGEVRTGLFTHDDESYRVVDTAAFRTAADVGQSEAGSVAQVGYSSCGSCGTSCGGNCGGGYSGGGYGGGGGYGNVCAPCDPYCYMSIEGLYMQRSGKSSYSASPNFLMSDNDYEWGSRVTIGSVPDCVHGYEASFTGLFDWDRGGFLTDAGGGIQTLLRAVAPVVPGHLSAFSNATGQTQTYRSRFWSVEGNSTQVGWEMAKVLWGIRYMEYDERFTYLSRSATEAGSLRSEVQNQLLGGQIGMDLLYPVCTNGYTDVRMRAGLFVNFADLDFRVFNNGSTVAANFQSREKLAGMLEFSGGYRYQIGEMLTLRAGGEVWYLARVASAPGQFRNLILANRKIKMKDDIWMTGISFGAELKY